ncbi:hypothetical protein JCM10207_001306 [Rhodosporidiobolus poonsookiae]
MSDSPPSVFLPPVHPPPPVSLVLSSLSRLSSFVSPPNAVIDLRRALPDLSSGSVPTEEAHQAAQEEEHEDEFERNYARGWLERIVAIGSRVLAKGGGDAEQWEQAVDEASGFVAVMSGPSAQGSSSKTYLLPTPSSARLSPLLPPTPPPTRPASTVPPEPGSSPSLTSPDALSLTIRDTTLLQNSTGHCTWGSAPLLSQRLASSPLSFFPLPTSTSTARPLRCLELGSGTGLVGLSAAAILARLSLPSGATVTLTDGGAEPAVLDNLARNVVSNAAALEGVKVHVAELDWREFLPLSSGVEGAQDRTVPDEERYDVLLAADVAYEPGMAEALHAAVAGLLRFPGLSAQLSSSSAPAPAPAFHLVIPLRPTHTRETADVARLFPLSPSPSPSSSSPISPASTPPVSLRADSTPFRLVARTRDELTGPDGFGGGAGRMRGRGRAEGEMRYWAMRVEWEEVGRG